MKDFVWIFDKQTFEVKDILEVSDYDIVMDEETNGYSEIEVIDNIDNTPNLLPNEYQRLSYIHFNGEQYLDLDYPLWETSKWTMETKFSIDKVYNYQHFYSVADDATAYEIWINNAGEYHTRLNSVNTYISNIIKDKVYTLKGINDDNYYTYLNNNLISTETKYTTSETRKLRFGKRGTGQFIGNLYNIKFWKDKELVLNLVPCYNKDTKEVGFFDLVEGNFLKNKGQGNLEKGDIIENNKPKLEENDILAFKQDNQITYWGIIKDVNIEDKRIQTQYITNLFNYNIPIDEGYMSRLKQNTSYAFDLSATELCLTPYQNATTDSSEVRALKEDSNNFEFSRWILEEQTVDGETRFRIKNKKTNLYLNTGSQNAIIRQMTVSRAWKLNYTPQTGTWEIYVPINGVNNYISVPNDSGVMTLTTNAANRQPFYVYTSDSEFMKEYGIERQIVRALEENYVNPFDDIPIYNFLNIGNSTITRKNISVTNVEDHIYNLHTWMSNCTKSYNIVYNFSVDNKRLRLMVGNQSLSKKMIDSSIQNVQNFSEVKKSDVVSKVVVCVNEPGEQRYYLYLKNDRTTTTNAADENRAWGKLEAVTCSNYEDAYETALDVFRANSYEHNVSFELDEYIPLGTPILIKVGNSLNNILDTYISSVRIRKGKFYEYQCGNMRINFIEKMRKGTK